MTRRSCDEFLDARPQQRTLEFGARSVGKGLRPRAFTRYSTTPRQDRIGWLWPVACGTAVIAVTTFSNNNQHLVLNKGESRIASYLEKGNLGISFPFFNGTTISLNVGMFVAVLFLAAFRGAIKSGASAGLLSAFLSLLESLDLFLMRSCQNSLAFALQAFLCIIFMRITVQHVIEERNKIAMTVVALIASFLTVQRIEFMVLYLPIVFVFLRICDSLITGVFMAIIIASSIGFIGLCDSTIGLPNLVNDVTIWDVFAVMMKTESNGAIPFSILVIVFMTLFTVNCTNNGAVRSLVVGVILAVMVLLKAPVSSKPDLAMSSVAVIRLLSSVTSGFVACHQRPKLQICASVLSVLCYLSTLAFPQYLTK